MIKYYKLFDLLNRRGLKKKDLHRLSVLLLTKLVPSMMLVMKLLLLTQLLLMKMVTPIRLASKVMAKL